MSKAIKVPVIQSLIIELRGQPVILDRDLAYLYQVSTKSLNQAVRRNQQRFPADFMFQLNKEEWKVLRSQIVTANNRSEKVRFLPYVFTRNGANMVSAILKSPLAVQRSIQIMRAFSTLEGIVGRRKKSLTNSPDISRQLATHSRAIMRLFLEDRLQGKQLEKIHEIQGKIVLLLQQIIVASLKSENDRS